MDALETLRDCCSCKFFHISPYSFESFSLAASGLPFDSFDPPRRTRWPCSFAKGPTTCCDAGETGPKDLRWLRSQVSSSNLPSTPWKPRLRASSILRRPSAKASIPSIPPSLSLISSRLSSLSSSERDRSSPEVCASRPNRRVRGREGDAFRGAGSTLKSSLSSSERDRSSPEVCASRPNRHGQGREGDAFRGAGSTLKSFEAAIGPAPGTRNFGGCPSSTLDQISTPHSPPDSCAMAVCLKPRSSQARMATEEDAPARQAC
mmetsp:Transcript_78145/g.253602  ORF Transcript_78145/g.253602 Transcript_78145/m.253602 type:complete len:262 (-) Transcript_78145:24-809(-)